MFQRFKSKIPNLLTISRIFLAFWCAYFALTQNTLSLSCSLILFIVASATDFLDGYLARRWKIISKFGKIVDPIADKILIISILIIFTIQGYIPIFITVIIVARELILTAIRLILLSKKIVIASINSGKIKTISQVGVLISIYLFLIFKVSILEYVDLSTIKNIIFGMAIWLACIAIYSAVEFFSINRKTISGIGW